MEEEDFLNGTEAFDTTEVDLNESLAERLCSVNASLAAAEGFNCSKFAVTAKCVDHVIPMT